MGSSGDDYGWSRPSIKDAHEYKSSQTIVSRSMTDRINMLADGQDSQDEMADEALDKEDVV